MESSLLSISHKLCATEWHVHQVMPTGCLARTHRFHGLREIYAEIDNFRLIDRTVVLPDAEETSRQQRNPPNHKPSRPAVSETEPQKRTQFLKGSAAGSQDAVVLTKLRGRELSCSHLVSCTEAHQHCGRTAQIPGKEVVPGNRLQYTQSQ